ncbi:L-2-hydroxyglutarate oxidase [Thaumasiovibrio subtropicus]|uniref:L-2-hydroxyglutarate oxidase n=1 Tax=Thaumasiovibrio subtropicus TaxID=1891207 RepID=UPI000B3548C9|nr:L-2-hydroxyglutarate oxidase [Thaumasiovibrio subtropicus]
MDKTADVLVVGAGIVGLATAREIQVQFPTLSVIVVDAEKGPAMHQTGHNSGVIHAGVYYKPGSKKAAFCKQGNHEIKTYCDEKSIPHFECGKLLVATNEEEYSRLDGLADRAVENGIKIECLNNRDLHHFEPNVVGEGAIFVPSTGIVNYATIAESLAEDILAAGGAIYYGQPLQTVTETETGVECQCGTLSISAGKLVACVGINADKVVTMLGGTPDFQMVPFRGEYYRLPERHRQIVRHLIYPVPDPNLPFLGVHLTRMINGDVTVGPNAVVNFSRDGYARWAFSFSDSLEMFGYKGFQHLIKKHWQMALQELRNSMWKRGYLDQVRKYCPDVTLDDLEPHPAGIRAQAVGPQGELIDDFLFHHTEHSVVVCNAPSPAATSCFPIARHIVSKLSL